MVGFDCRHGVARGYFTQHNTTTTFQESRQTVKPETTATCEHRFPEAEELVKMIPVANACTAAARERWLSQAQEIIDLDRRTSFIDRHSEILAKPDEATQHKHVARLRENVRVRGIADLQKKETVALLINDLICDLAGLTYRRRGDRATRYVALLIALAETRETVIRIPRWVRVTAEAAVGEAVDAKRYNFRYITLPYDGDYGYDYYPVSSRAMFLVYGLVRHHIPGDADVESVVRVPLRRGALLNWERKTRVNGTKKGLPIERAIQTFLTQHIDLIKPYLGMGDVPDGVIEAEWPQAGVFGDDEKLEWRGEIRHHGIKIAGGTTETQEVDSFFYDTRDPATHRISGAVMELKSYSRPLDHLQLHRALARVKATFPEVEDIHAFFCFGEHVDERYALRIIEVSYSDSDLRDTNVVADTRLFIDAVPAEETSDISDGATSSGQMQKVLDELETDFEDQPAQRAGVFSRMWRAAMRDRHDHDRSPAGNR